MSEQNNRKYDVMDWLKQIESETSSCDSESRTSEQSKDKTVQSKTEDQSGSQSGTSGKARDRIVVNLYMSPRAG